MLGASSMRRRQFIDTVGTLGIALANGNVKAQTQRTVRLVVPFTPGGTTDILARLLAPKLSAGLNVNLIVENRPGAGGSIGAAEVARAAPDGNTLLMGHIGTLAVNPSLYPKLSYDPLRSFEPVAWVANVPNVLVIHSDASVNSMKDWLQMVKAKPGRFTYSSGGNGSAAHIAFEYLKLRAGLFMVHVPYRGTAGSIADLLGKQVDATFTGVPAVLPLIRANKLRALAVSSRQRLMSLPNVPTVIESGIADFEADQWYGVVAPKGTPLALVARINQVVNEALANTELLAQLSNEGAIAASASPNQFGQLIEREIPRWREVVNKAKMQPD
jgi:tripartite-type tricarboxylate transporter receptor subunit TctC